MRRTLFFAVTSFLGFAAAAWSQDSPSAPIVLKPANEMAWKMTVKSGKDSQPPSEAKGPGASSENNEPSEAVLLEYVSSNGLTKVVVNFDKGPKREYWKFGRSVLCQMAGGPDIQLLPDDYPRYPFASRGFYGVENVRPEHFQGESEWEKTRCRYYRGQRTATFLEKPSLMGEAPRAKVEYEAWFDAKTGLPKAYKADGRTFVYEFSTGPVPSLILPQEWQAALDKHKLDLKRAGLAR